MMRKFWLWQSVTWSYWDGHAVTVLMMFLPAVFELVGRVRKEKSTQKDTKRTHSNALTHHK